MEAPTPATGSYGPFLLKEKIDEMIRYSRPLTLQFGRRNRDLADDIRATMLQMLRLSIELEKKYYRKTTTQELDVELECLRHLVRLAANKDYCGPKFAPPLSKHQYEVWARYNSEIGRLIGGYINSLNR